jgi:hypothetical protein
MKKSMTLTTATTAMKNLPIDEALTQAFQATDSHGNDRGVRR